MIKMDGRTALTLVTQFYTDNPTFPLVIRDDLVKGLIDNTVGEAMASVWLYGAKWGYAEGLLHEVRDGIHVRRDSPAVEPPVTEDLPIDPAVGDTGTA